MGHSRLFFLLLPLAAIGCAARSTSTLSLASGSSPMQLWVRQEGGLINDSRQQRVEKIARPLLACCHGRPVTLQVFASDQLCAFAWPSGHIFVSRGLIDHLSDQELAAAIAHELGHLLCDGRLSTMASLCGSGVPNDREVRADAAGLALLREANIPPKAMLSMLKKVAAGVDAPAYRQAMQRRIQIMKLELASAAAN